MTQDSEKLDDTSIEYTVNALKKMAHDAEAVGKKNHAQYWLSAAQMIEALAAENRTLKSEIWDWREGVLQP